jgi:hypothetical protein
MPVGQEHHECVSMTVAVLPDGLDQLLDLIGRQVLACAQLSVWRALRRDCSILVIGVTSRRFEFVMIYALPATATVQTIGIF